MRFQIAVTSKCGRFWLSSVQRARGLGGEKRKKKIEVVKYKSADMYVERPKYAVFVRPPDVVGVSLRFYAGYIFFLLFYFVSYTLGAYNETQPNFVACLNVSQILKYLSKIGVFLPL